MKLEQFQKGFSGVNEPTQEKLGDFLIFRVCLAHKYLGDLASDKISPATIGRPSVSTRG